MDRSQQNIQPTSLTHRKCARNGVPAGADECASVGLFYGTNDERTQSGNEEVGIEAGADTEGGQTQTTAEADLWGGSDHGGAGNPVHREPRAGAYWPLRCLT
jgi:hypothetical protein